jgi:hypothetical protein
MLPLHPKQTYARLLNVEPKKSQQTNKTINRTLDWLQLVANIKNSLQQLL